MRHGEGDWAHARRRGNKWDRACPRLRVGISPGSGGGCGRRVDNLGDIPGVLGRRCDVRNHADVQDLIEKTVEALGGLDEVVYVAGVSSIMPVGETPLERWRSVYDTNVFGAVDVVQEALPHLTVLGHRVEWCS